MKKRSAIPIPNLDVFSSSLDDPVQPGESIQELSIETIQPNPWQPRREFDPEGLTELVESIQEFGVIEPVVVRSHPETTGYQLIVGERRLRAATQAGLQKIPAVIREASDRDCQLIALAENLHRKDLNPLDTLEGVLNLVALQTGQTPDQIKKVTRQAGTARRENQPLEGEVAEQAQVLQAVLDKTLKISIESFGKQLALLKLPEDLKAAICTQNLPYTKALEVAKLASIEARQALIAKVLADPKTFSVSFLRREVRALKAAQNSSTQTLQNPESTLPLTELATQSRSRVQQAMRKVTKKPPEGKKEQQARKVLAQIAQLADKLESLLE